MSSINCEVCSTEMSTWQLDKKNTLFKCQNCGHIKRDLELCNANSRVHSWGGYSVFDKIRNSLTFSRIKKLFLSGTGKLDIFEIGFGSGYLLNKVYQSGHNVSGIEKGLLEIDVIDELEKNADLQKGDIDTAELKENSYDLVYGIHLIEHIQDTNSSLKKIHKSLKKGGHLYLITPNGNSSGLKIFKTAWWNLEDPTHYRFYSPRSITEQLEKLGYKNIKVNILKSDSLMVESNSIIRKLSSNSKNHGVLDTGLSKIIDLLLLPLTIIIRNIYPKISSSIEIIAEK